MKHCLTIITIFLLAPLPYLKAQSDNSSNQKKSYTPRKLHSGTSANMIVDFIYSKLANELQTIESGPVKEMFREINAERGKNLLQRVTAKDFIQDDTLESYVSEIMDRIVQKNSIRNDRRIILLSRSPAVNASCVGRGIFIINIGLIGRTFSEDQLAFTLAHEMAHDELNHIQLKLLKQIRINLSKKEASRPKSLENINIKDIQEYRELIYSLRDHDRKYEIQADSLALIYTNNAGYSSQGSISMLSLLDNPMGLKYEIGEEVFLPFHTEEYPFLIEWLDTRASVYSKKAEDTYLFSQDSLKSHPEIQFRIETLKGKYNLFGTENQDEEFVKSAITTAEFETIEGCFHYQKYDLCLYYALQLLYRYPRNVYLTNTIGDILIKLYKARDDFNFSSYVSKYTSNYSEEARLVNNFLYNLTTKEFGELTFHFIKNRDHFNSTEKANYYLLMTISDLLYRNDEVRDIKKKFKENFGISIQNYHYERVKS